MKMPGKNFNFKKTMLDHGEKVAFGAVALMGLAALGMARWSPYKEKDPFKILDDVRVAQNQQKSTTWPETEQEKFKTTENIAEKAEKLLAGVDEAKFDFGRTLDGMWDPIIPQKQPVDEPTWFPIRDLIADQGYLLYEKAVAYEDTLVAADGSELSPEGDVASSNPGRGGGDDFSPAAPTTGFDGGSSGYGLPGMAPPGYTPPGAGSGYTPPGMGGAAGRGAGGRGAGARGAAGRGGSPSGYESEMPGMPGMPGDGYGGLGGYGMGGGTVVEGVAKRYVAVRGVFPLKQQEEELARARSQSRAEVAGLLTFTDFELERQQAVPGADPWAGPWAKVDIQVANDVLNDQARFDFDPVDPTVTNAVFTMPLPGRVMGTWTEKGSHPALTQFDQSDEFQRKSERLQQLIADYAAELERQRKLEPQFGGFANQQFDAGQVGRMMMADEGYMNSMTSGMMTQPGMAGGDPTTLTKDDIKALITASGTYLLFRYIDFDVQPGNAYRYRVRLKLLNPNKGLPLDQVARPDVAEGDDRWTDWSEPTAAVVVPKDAKRFLVAVEQGGARQADRARFEMFQWSTETGTIVNEEIVVEPGQFIAGTQAAEVLDVAGQKFENKDFEFLSGDLLVDIDHAGLGLSGVRPELSLPRKYETPSQILVVDDSGELQVQDPYTDAPARTRAEAGYQGMAEAFAYLKEAAAPALDEAAGMYGEMMEGAGRGAGGRGGNPLRRGSRGRGGMPGMMPGGMPGSVDASGGLAPTGRPPRRGSR